MEPCNFCYLKKVREDNPNSLIEVFKVGGGFELFIDGRVEAWFNQEPTKCTCIQEEELTDAL